MTYDCHLYTTPGGRSVNEDSADYLFEDGIGLMAAADGLGGHADGKAASQLCVDTLMQGVYRCDPAADFAHANQLVLELQKGAFSTLAAAYFYHDLLQCVTVGDTRAYVFRNGCIVYQSLDDSVPQMMVSLGELSQEQISSSPDRNRLLSVIGSKKQPKPRFSPKIPLASGDAVLLCTDGAWELLYEAEMLLELVQSSHAKDWCERLALRLTQRQSPVSDNATLLCCMIKQR